MLLRPVSEPIRHVNAIHHEGKVVLVATDAGGKIWYAVKQDGFEDSYLNQTTAVVGWEDWRELELPAEEDDPSVLARERELTYAGDDGQDRYLVRSRYHTRGQSAAERVGLLSGMGHLYVFRQSRASPDRNQEGEPRVAPSTLLVDRYVLDGLTNKLVRKLDVRFKRSGQKHEPYRGRGGGRRTFDSMDFRDPEGRPFFEPTTELTLLGNLTDGLFSPVLVPTVEHDRFRWHLFAYDEASEEIRLVSIRASEEGLFDVRDDPVLEPSPARLPGIVRRSLVLSTPDGPLGRPAGLAAAKYDELSEQETPAGPQLMRDATRLMLTVTDDRGETAAVSFALDGHGLLAEGPGSSALRRLRGDDRRVLLPLSTLRDVRAVGDVRPRVEGSIEVLMRDSEGRDRVVVCADNAGELETGDRVRIRDTTSYDGRYRVEEVDGDAFAVRTRRGETESLGSWRKVEDEGSGQIFEGMITGYEASDDFLAVLAPGHGLEEGDEVQLVDTGSYDGTYPIVRIDDESFALPRRWRVAEARKLERERRWRGICFNGPDDHVEVPDLELGDPGGEAPADCTVSAWVKLSRHGGATILRRNDLRLELVHENGGVELRLVTEGRRFTARDPWPPTEEWVHYAGTIASSRRADGGRDRLVQLYRNGRRVARTSTAGDAEWEVRPVAEGGLVTCTCRWPAVLAVGDTSARFLFSAEGKTEVVATLDIPAEPRPSAVVHWFIDPDSWESHCLGAVGLPSAGEVLILRVEGDEEADRIVLREPNGDLESRFGHAVAWSLEADGEFIMVGAPAAGSDRRGAAYLVAPDEEDPESVALLPETSTEGGRFGSAVGMGRDFWLVGEPGAAGGGAVHVFHYDEDDDEGRLFVAHRLSGQGSEGFGCALAVDLASDTVVVGEEGGGAHLFHRVDGRWNHVCRLEPGSDGDSRGFGAAVDVRGNRVAVGAPEAGAVYLYELGEAAATLLCRTELPAAGSGFGSTVGVAGELGAFSSAPGAGSVHLIGRIQGEDEPVTGLGQGPGLQIGGGSLWVAEAQIWSRARSAEEIEDTMYLEPGGREPGLEAYWRMSSILGEGAERRVADFAGGGNDGLVRGNPFSSGCTLERYLRLENEEGEPVAATVFVNDELTAVSQRATYEESFELLPLAADGGHQKPDPEWFHFDLWGRRGRRSHERLPVARRRPRLESLGDGWYRASCTYTVPDEVGMMRLFGIALDPDARQPWERIEVRRHRLISISNSISESAARDELVLARAGRASTESPEERRAAQRLEQAGRELEMWRRESEVARQSITLMFPYSNDTRTLPLGRHNVSGGTGTSIEVPEGLTVELFERMQQAGERVVITRSAWNLEPGKLSLIVKTSAGNDDLAVIERRLADAERAFAEAQRDLERVVDPEVRGRWLVAGLREAQAKADLLIAEKRDLQAKIDLIKTGGREQLERELGRARSALAAGQDRLRATLSRLARWRTTLDSAHRGITIYQHYSYQGDQSPVHLGRHNICHWGWNDKVSSVRVPDGLQVELYYHEDYRGRMDLVTKDDEKIRMTDEVSSVIVMTKEHRYDRIPPIEKEIADAERDLKSVKATVQDLENEVGELQRMLDLARERENLERRRDEVLMALRELESEIERANRAALGEIRAMASEPLVMHPLGDPEPDEESPGWRGAMLPGGPRPRELGSFVACSGNVELHGFDGDGRICRQEFDAVADRRNAEFGQWLPPVAIRACLECAQRGTGVRLERAVPLGVEWTVEAWVRLPTATHGQLDNKDLAWQPFRDRGSAESVSVLVASSARDRDAAIAIVDGHRLGTRVDGTFVDSGFDLRRLAAGNGAAAPGSGWHHLAAVGKKGTTTFFVDGEEAGSETLRRAQKKLEALEKGSPRRGKVLADLEEQIAELEAGPEEEHDRLVGLRRERDELAANDRVRKHAERIRAARSEVESTQVGVQSQSPIVAIGNSIDGEGDLAAEPFGQIAEVRVWSAALTADELAVNATTPPTGHEPALEAYLRLDEAGDKEAEGEEADGDEVRDRTGRGHDGVVVRGGWRAFTGEMGPRTGAESPSAPAVAEYSAFRTDPASGRRSAMMRRLYAYPDAEGVRVLADKRVEALDLVWVGNAQFQPTLLGYIEGAPPLPTENLTAEESYNGATAVELTMSEDVEFSWTREQEAGLGTQLELFIGVDQEIELTKSAGVGAEVGTTEKALATRAGFAGDMALSYDFLNASSVTAASGRTVTDRLELHGTREARPKFPHLGRRFIPKNVGYAVVVSSLADVFISKLARSGRMVGYRTLPIPEIPPDVNTITFLINPAYTMQGSLDGLTGSAATSDRFFRHVPEMRSQYGSLYPASYYRLEEAYALKQQIEYRDKLREAYFRQFNARLVDQAALGAQAQDSRFSAGAPTVAGGGSGSAELDAEVRRLEKRIEELEAGPRSPEETIELARCKKQLATKKAEQQHALRSRVTDLENSRYAERNADSGARQAEIGKRAGDAQRLVHASAAYAAWQKKMESLQVLAGKRNIANTYVWDADGGLHAESEHFANTVEHTIGGSFNLDTAMGGSKGFKAFGVGFELNAQATVHLTQTMTKTEARSTGFELVVDLDGVESSGVTDHDDLPLMPGEKVDRYRFTSFFLEGSTENYKAFFDQVVDPEWLASNDEEARALRQARGKANKTWRVLHRVTFVERPALAGFGSDPYRLVEEEPDPTDKILERLKELEEAVQKLLESRPAGDGA